MAYQSRMIRRTVVVSSLMALAVKAMRRRNDDEARLAEHLLSIETPTSSYDEDTKTITPSTITTCPGDTDTSDRNADDDGRIEDATEDATSDSCHSEEPSWLAGPERRVEHSMAVPINPAEPSILAKPENSVVFREADVDVDAVAAVISPREHTTSSDELKRRLQGSQSDEKEDNRDEPTVSEAVVVDNLARILERMEGILKENNIPYGSSYERGKNGDDLARPGLKRTESASRRNITRALKALNKDLKNFLKEPFIGTKLTEDEGYVLKEIRRRCKGSSTFINQLINHLAGAHPANEDLFSRLEFNLCRVYQNFG